MTLVESVFIIAALLCSLVAGLLFAFAAVIMPGLSRLDDEGFLRAFKAIDRVIQENQPLFMLVWVGSVVALLAAAVLGLPALDGTNRLLLAAALCVYLACVQLPTAVVNLPLNNALQKLDLSAMDDTARRRARAAFEPRWNRWNVRRTVCAVATSLLLLMLLLRV